MASSQTYYARQNYRLCEPTGPAIPDSLFELDESDIWTVNVSPETRKNVPTSRFINKSKTVKRDAGASRTVASSLPVSVPDWSKILKQDYTENRRSNSDEDDFDFDCDDDEDRIPPHEFLARTRNASFSVHEGIGRTLKGRDLSRVRNAIWAKTGFED
ncbi:senescence regulator [Tanacetum coccineum]